MDNQFGTSYPLAYSQSTQSPAQVAPMGAYAGLTGQQTQTQNASTSQTQDSAHPTLPPLQSQNGYHFGSMSYGHNSGAPTPTSHTPTSSAMGSGPNGSFSHVSPATMGPPSGYSSHYPMTQSMMYSSPTTTSLPQPGTANGLAALRPALPTSLGPLPSLSATHLGAQPSFLQNEEAPTHVVGSQGRRGILPSAPGRPNAATGGQGTSIKNMMPQKDADGKFPCPHCNKTYLHAKHLKRHMLRHTGDRPYSCHLCKDTFSRSDILKRHFQKCSIRRGNPTGANHLAHQRRGNNTNNRLSISQQEGPVGLAGLAEVNGNPYATDSSPTVTGDVSTRTSRANSLISPANMSHRSSIAGLGILGNGNATDPLSGQPAAFAPNMHAYGLPSVSGAPQLTSAYSYTQPSINGAYFTPPNAQGMPYLGHQTSRFDHSHSNSPSQQSPNGDSNHSHQVFQNGQDSFLNGDGAQVKSEHDVKHFPNDINNDLGNGNGMGVVWS